MKRREDSSVSIVPVSPEGGDRARGGDERWGVVGELSGWRRRTMFVLPREAAERKERRRENERERGKKHGGGGCYGYTAAITIRPTIL